MTWAQIKTADRMGLGFETIARSSITAGIPRHITDDVRLLAFRFFGNAPMVGYRDGRVFFVLWLDRSFTLYNHG